MKLTQSSVEKVANTLIKLGEAGVIGSVGSLFVKDFDSDVSFIGIAIGIYLIILGVFVNERAEEIGG